MTKSPNLKDHFNVTRWRDSVTDMAQNTTEEKHS